jgi:hypothetical protein
MLMLAAHIGTSATYTQINFIKASIAGQTKLPGICISWICVQMAHHISTQF